MREHKFRAWDDDAEILIYSDQEYDEYFFEFKDGKLRAFKIIEHPGTINEPPYPEAKEIGPIDEYIGKNDPEGEGLYEGDQCTYTDITDPLSEVKLPTVGVVNWYDARCGFVLQEARENHKGGHYITPWDYAQEIEVIGNIHESDKPSLDVRKQGQYVGRKPT